MIYLEIFLCYFQIGLFSVGGGYASIPVIKSMVVDGRGWMTMHEYLDMITLAEMTPGPFALNSATFVGVKMGGVFGGALATFSCMLPSLMIIVLLAFFYKKYKNMAVVGSALAGIRPAVAALIAGAGVSMLMTAFFGTNVIAEISGIDLIAVILAVGAFVLLRWKKINPVLMILMTGATGAAVYFVYDMAI